MPIRTVAETIAAHLRVPAVSVSPDEAGDYVGWLGGLWAVDGPASAQLTREFVGWGPNGPGLIADRRQGHYST
ncbi:hypothetical protein [Actinoplanes solisilvae]|uniref:hypothetical protein n=1 Tax=Actinoplanes solisilvae TaxID=2486853 RepID=UPI00196BAB48|nr:hypothetical protein [Actinoplanes solisilvae]